MVFGKWLKSLGPQDTHTVVPYGLDFLGRNSTYRWYDAAPSPSGAVVALQAEVGHQSLENFPDVYADIPLTPTLEGWHL